MNANWECPFSSYLKAYFSSKLNTHTHTPVIWYYGPTQQYIRKYFSRSGVLKSLLYIKLKSNFIILSKHNLHSGNIGEQKIRNIYFNRICISGVFLTIQGIYVTKYMGKNYYLCTEVNMIWELGQYYKCLRVVWLDGNASVYRHLRF